MLVVCLCIDVVAVECVEAEPRAVRCDAEYRKGKGWQSGHVRLIPGRGASARGGRNQ